MPLEPNNAAGVSLRLAMTLAGADCFCSPPPPFLDFTSLSALVVDAIENDNTVPLIRTIGQVFGNLESVNQCFLRVRIRASSYASADLACTRSPSRVPGLRCVVGGAVFSTAWEALQQRHRLASITRRSITPSC